MKWLQWTLADPFKEIGGAEIFALCIAKELEHLGVEVCFSQDPRDLFEQDKFDVVQTHGSALPKWSSFKKNRPKKSLRIHTVHGSSLAYGKALGRRSTGLWKAGLRELEGCLSADIVWTCVQSPLLQHQIVGALKKPLHYSLNGWDSAATLKSYLDWKKLSSDELNKLQGRWLFVGRARDQAKQYSRFLNIAQHPSEFRFASIPGDDTEESSILNTGKLNPSSIQDALKASAGLILTSAYEACPLVVLEALAAGVPVVSSPISNLKDWDRKFENFSFFRDVDNLESSIEDLQSAVEDAVPQQEAEKINKSRIPTWKEIAEKHLELVTKFQAQ